MPVGPILPPQGPQAVGGPTGKGASNNAALAALLLMQEGVQALVQAPSGR